jgi:type IV pilus assembly protein PilM
MTSTGLGVTIGSHSLRAVKVRRKGAAYVVQRVFADRLNEDTRPVAGRALAARGLKGGGATVGLTGRDVIIRYSQVPPVPDWRLRTLMAYEVEEVSSQSGGDVSADYRKLNLPDPEGTRDEETILVSLARNQYLDRLIKALGSGGIGFAGGCPNSVALFNAYAVNATYSEQETSLLVNIGAEDLDIAIQQGGELLFARNAHPGGAAFTAAIEAAFSTTAGKAEKMKLAKADVTPRGQARYPDSTAEKVANSIMGVAGQMASLIQSTLLIARAQAKLPDLKVDKVVLAGGGASLKGLDLYLKQAMGVPVERLDPFAISDLSALTDEEREMVTNAPHEFAVAMGLAQARTSPLAFPLSVLPEALRRRREFVTKGLWCVGAGVAAAGILLLLHQARSKTADKAHRLEAQVRRQISSVQNDDDRLRKALRSAQEAEVKHQILADLAAPGALLGRVMSVLDDNLRGTREVYLESVRLQVGETANEFTYYKPRVEKSLASGYEETSRRRYFRRQPSVRVVARISGTTNAAAVHQDFVTRCQKNDQGLLVKTETGLVGGRRTAEDASFELEFRAGVELRLVTTEGNETGRLVVVDAALDEARDPGAILGRRVDGVAVRIPRERIAAEDWRDLSKRLPAVTGEGGN